MNKIDLNGTPGELDISNEVVDHLFRRARGFVEDVIWKDGLVWYPAESRRRISPTGVAEAVFPDPGGPKEKICAREIQKFTGMSMSTDGARAWFVAAVEESFDDFVRRAREKVDRIEMVVTNSSITVEAVRPPSTKPSVGPAPWDTDL